jgi:hypothetical protein
MFKTFTRKSTLLTIALGLTALGSTTIPAAAGFSQLVHASPITPTAFPHPVMPMASKVIGSTQQKPIPTLPGGASQKPAGVEQKPPVPTTVKPGPIAGPTINNQPLKVPVGDICAEHPTECAPHHLPFWPKKKDDDDDSKKGGPIPVPVPVVIAGSTAVVAPVYVQPAQVPTYTQPTVARAPATTTPVAQEPCNCLTKQYLDDGSVLFRDLCTREAAIATAAELKAQAQAQSAAQ